MIKYELLVGYTKSDPKQPSKHALNELVNEKLGEGYELYGNPFAYTNSISNTIQLCQAVVKKEE